VKNQISFAFSIEEFGWFDWLVVGGSSHVLNNLA